jgi:hypothetical protein
MKNFEHKPEKDLAPAAGFAFLPRAQAGLNPVFSPALNRWKHVHNFL